jgi:hypothetical protein
MNRVRRGVLWSLTLAAILSALPPIGNLLMRTMLTQMLVQIPLLFTVAAIWAGRMRWPSDAGWLAWNAQGATGLLAVVITVCFWMMPIALDHAASEWWWEAGKIISLATAGFVAGVSWRLGSAVTHIFFLGNMLWMSVTIGMLYQESTQRYCNAYLWDDQVMTGQALVVASIGVALIAASRAVARAAR